MNTQANVLSAAPAPAGLQGPFEPGEAVSLRLWDGSEVSGILQKLSSTEVTLASRDAGAEASARSLSDVRFLRFLRAVDYLESADVFRRNGMPMELLPTPRPFAITFRDKQVMVGELRGYGADSSALGLYQLGEKQETLRVLVPSNGITSFAVGERLGTLLLSRGELSPDGLDLALERQRALRQQQLGSLLLERSLVTRGQLEDALARQKKKSVMPLGEVLVDMGIITKPQLEDALVEQRRNRRRPLGEILLEHKLVSTEVLHRVLAEKLGIPYVDLAKYRLEANWYDLASYPVCRQYRVIPLYQAGDKITIAIENPLDLERLRAVSFALSRPVVPVLASSEDIEAVLAKHPERRLYESDRDGPALLERAPEAAAESEAAEALVQKLSLELRRGAESPLAGTAGVGDSTLVRLVNKIILDAHQGGVSDVHIEPGDGRERVRVRFRRDGALYEYLSLSGTFRAAIVSRLKVMANLDISEHRQAQDGKIDMKRFAGIDLELRVAVVPTQNGLEAVVLRLLAAATAMPLSDIGLDSEMLRRLRDMAEKPYGLIIVCGPTGSGKTTTLHSILGHVNKPETKIWTAEDPIEITQPGLTQVQVQPGIGWTFATALRSFLRADPDVIMVGEVRDAETARIAVEASLTGHLVLTTLHTNSAAESATRLIDMGVDPFNFADALVGVLAQRLARRVCQRCRRMSPAGEEVLQALANEYCAGTSLDQASVLADWHARYSRDGSIHLAQATGCRVCSQIGFNGRVPVYELLVVTHAMKRLLLRQASVEELRDLALQEGMRTLKQNGIEKVLQGLTTIEQIRAVAS